MNAISGASAATATPAVAQSAHPDPALDERAVVFRGDGEPKSPAGIVRRLAELDAESALSPDNYSLGGSVEALERHFAGLLGTEAAIFMPTGTLANHLAIRRHCGTRPRAIVQEQSHLYHDSGDCVTRLSAINLVPLASGRPHFTVDELDEALGASTGGRVLNEVGAVMIESPVRRQSGRVVPIDVMRQVTQLCRERGIPTHLDGARLFMMAGATGIRAADYAALFDTTYVSLYKYFGAHFGAILCGSADFVDGLYHERRPVRRRSARVVLRRGARSERRTGIRGAVRRRHGQGGSALRGAEHAFRRQRGAFRERLQHIPRRLRRRCGCPPGGRKAGRARRIRLSPGGAAGQLHAHRQYHDAQAEQ